MLTALKWVGIAILFLLIAFGLAVAIVPRFLDRIYYRGPVSDHFDGARFFNPDGDDTFRAPGGRSRGGFLWRYITGSDGRPPWPETVPVTPSKPAARVEGEAMVATWIGHATMLVQTQGLNILTDPIYAGKGRAVRVRAAAGGAAGGGVRRPAQDRRRAGQPQSLRPHGPEDAEAPCGTATGRWW